MLNLFESTIKSHPQGGEVTTGLETFEITTFRDRNLFNVVIQDKLNHHQTQLHFVIDGHIHAIVGEKGYYQESFLIKDIIEKSFQIYVTTESPIWQTESKQLPDWNVVEEVGYDDDNDNDVELVSELQVLQFFKSEDDFGLFFQLQEGVDQAKFCIEILVYPEWLGCGVIEQHEVELKASSAEGNYFYLPTNSDYNNYRVLKRF